MVVTPLTLGSQLAGAGAVPLLILFRRTKSQSDEPCSERASQSATAREACIVATCNQVHEIRQRLISESDCLQSPSVASAGLPSGDGRYIKFPHRILYPPRLGLRPVQPR